MTHWSLRLQVSSSYMFLQGTVALAFPRILLFIWALREICIIMACRLISTTGISSYSRCFILFFSVSLFLSPDMILWFLLLCWMHFYLRSPSSPAVGWYNASMCTCDGTRKSCWAAWCLAHACWKSIPWCGLRLYFYFSSELMLHIWFHQLLFIQNFQSNYEFWSLFSCQVNMTEFSSTKWLSNLKVINSPFSRFKLLWRIWLLWNHLIFLFILWEHSWHSHIFHVILKAVLDNLLRINFLLSLRAMIVGF